MLWTNSPVQSSGHSSHSCDMLHGFNQTLCNRPEQLQRFLIQSAGIRTPRGFDLFHIPHSPIPYFACQKLIPNAQWKWFFFYFQLLEIFVFVFLFCFFGLTIKMSAIASDPCYGRTVSNIDVTLQELKFWCCCYKKLFPGENLKWISYKSSRVSVYICWLGWKKVRRKKKKNPNTRSRKRCFVLGLCNQWTCWTRACITFVQ